MSMTADQALHRLRAHALAVAVVRPDVDLVDATECIADELDRLREREFELLAALKFACGNYSGGPIQPVDEEVMRCIAIAKERRAQLRLLTEMVEEEGGAT